MICEECSVTTDMEFREILLDVPKTDLECIKQINGFEDYNPTIETCIMMKYTYGKNDDQYIGRKKLHQLII